MIDQNKRNFSLAAASHWPARDWNMKAEGPPCQLLRHDAAEKTASSIFDQAEVMAPDHSPDGVAASIFPAAVERARINNRPKGKRAGDSVPLYDPLFWSGTVSRERPPQGAMMMIFPCCAHPDVSSFIKLKPDLNKVMSQYFHPT